jgi:hypothetical protein
VAPSPIGHHHAAREVVPAAAAEDAVVAIDAGVIDVVASFPGVAEEVVQAPIIGLEEADGAGAAVAVAFVPGDGVQVTPKTGLENICNIVAIMDG